MAGTKKELEKINGEPVTIETIQENIPAFIEDYCTRHNIDDLKKESNNIFNAMLLEINKTYIEPNKKQLLKYDHGTNNKYDPNKLNSLLDLYILLAMQYDSTVTILGFSIIAGMKYDTVLELQHDTQREMYNNITKETHRETSKTGSEVYQKLLYYEEQSTLNCRKYNDLRIIARLNRITGGAYRDYTQVETAGNKPQATAGAIVEKYGTTAIERQELPQE